MEILQSRAGERQGEGGERMNREEVMNALEELLKEQERTCVALRSAISKLRGAKKRGHAWSAEARAKASLARTMWWKNRHGVAIRIK